ncbi:MAG: capsular polysaccharide export protein, LipB/KpsS family [Armatimonadota bacterium]
MHDTKKTVGLLWHPGYQYHLFGLMAKALPSEVIVKRLGTPQLVLEKKFLSFLPRKPIQVPDSLESLVLRDYTRITCNHPEWATEQFKNKVRRIANEWYQYFYHKLEDVDLLVVWHGYKRPGSIAALVAKEHGAQVIYCENGLLPKTLAMDPLGINFENCLTGLSPDFYRNVAMDPAKRDALLNTALQQRQFKKTVRVKTDDCDDHRELPERYVLYAMQVHDDSQVLMFSQRFPSMETAVPYVADRLAAYNKLHNDTLKLVIKEHPTDYGRIDYTAMRAALPDAYFLRTTPVSEIIDRAAAVVTLNSTVGVEGLLHFKPVITLGDACYNILGMVWHVGSDDDMVDMLEGALNTPVDRDLITRFLYFLRYEYLVAVSKNNCTIETIGPAVDRIMDVLHRRFPKGSR